MKKEITVGAIGFCLLLGISPLLSQSSRTLKPGFYVVHSNDKESLRERFQRRSNLGPLRVYREGGVLILTGAAIGRIAAPEGRVPETYESENSSPKKPMAESPQDIDRSTPEKTVAIKIALPAPDRMDPTKKTAFTADLHKLIAKINDYKNLFRAEEQSETAQYGPAPAGKSLRDREEFLQRIISGLTMVGELNAPAAEKNFSDALVELAKFTAYRKNQKMPNTPFFRESLIEIMYKSVESAGGTITAE